MKYAFFAAAMICANVAYAQDFSVSLGGKSLGQLGYSAQGQSAKLTSTLNQTPMGVFNGTFTGTSKSNTFTGVSKSSRKQRRVVVDYSGGRPIKVEITPAEERTDLSDPNQAKGAVLDPVRAVEQLLGAKGCPAALRIYDGRRVVSMTPTDETQTPQTLSCHMSYKVVQGPGHLSPLRISSAKMHLQYGIAGGKQTLQQIKVSSGVFGLTLDRVN